MPPGQRAEQHVRRAGEDLARGKPALAAGKRLGPAEIGLLASLGIGEVRVRRRLRVAFFSTGDEVASIGRPLAPGEIYDSNRYTLYGALTRLGVDLIDMGVVRAIPHPSDGFVENPLRRTARGRIETLYQALCPSRRPKSRHLTARIHTPAAAVLERVGYRLANSDRKRAGVIVRQAQNVAQSGHPPSGPCHIRSLSHIDFGLRAANIRQKIGGVANVELAIRYAQYGLPVELAFVFIEPLFERPSSASALFALSCRGQTCSDTPVP